MESARVSQHIERTDVPYAVLNLDGKMPQQVGCSTSVTSRPVKKKVKRKGAKSVN